MKDIQHVMVMGAGAVGGYFGGRLAERTEARVTLIARGAHLKAIRQSGLQLKSIDGDITVQVEAFEDPMKAPLPDLILFTVKSFDTYDAIEQIKPVVVEHTQIITIQNGIENYPKLKEAFGERRVIQGFCKIGAGIFEPGIIQHKALGNITVGEKDGSTSSRLKTFQKLCKQADIPLEISNAIERDIWMKFTWNGIFNMITAVANVTVEKLFEHRETEALCYKVFEEIQAVAKAEGVSITAKDGKKMIESARNLKGFTTSTYQDRQKGKKLEYEAFTGAIVRLAEKHDLEVPHNRTLYALLKMVDKAR